MWTRLASIDRRWIFLAMGVAVSMPFVLKWVLLPGPINPRTQALYDFIEKAKPGDVVMIGIDYGPSSMPELHPMAIAVTRHALMRDLRVMTLSLNTQGSLLADDVLETVAEDMPEKKDGTDFVNLGFKPGGSLVLLGMGDSIPKTFGKDSRGRELGTLPVMKGVNSFKDVYLAVDLSSSSVVFTWILFAGEKFGQALAAGVTAVLITDIYPYLDTGQLVGAMNGLRGAAEYEKLIDHPDKALLGMTSQSVAHVLIILFVAIGNIGYFAGKRRGAR